VSNCCDYSGRHDACRWYDFSALDANEEFREHSNVRWSDVTPQPLPRAEAVGAQMRPHNMSWCRSSDSGFRSGALPMRCAFLCSGGSQVVAIHAHEGVRRSRAGDNTRMQRRVALEIQRELAQLVIVAARASSRLAVQKNPCLDLFGERLGKELGKQVTRPDPKQMLSGTIERAAHSTETNKATAVNKRRKAGTELVIRKNSSLCSTSLPRFLRQENTSSSFGLEVPSQLCIELFGQLVV
jgi:hypothetical protein